MEYILSLERCVGRVRERRNIYIHIYMCVYKKKGELLVSSAVERECCRMPAKSVQPLRSLVYGLELITNNVLLYDVVVYRVVRHHPMLVMSLVLVSWLLEAQMLHQSFQHYFYRINKLEISEDFKN